MLCTIPVRFQPLTPSSPLLWANWCPEIWADKLPQWTKPARNGKYLKGRQILFRIYEHFRTAEEEGALYGLEDLMAVNLIHDDLRTFLASCESVLAGMKQQPWTDVLHVLLLLQLRQSRQLQQDLAYVQHGDKSYEFLLSCVRKLLERKRLESNRAEIA